MTTVATATTTKEAIKTALRTFRKQGYAGYILGIKSEFSNCWTAFDKKLSAKGLDFDSSTWVYAKGFSDGFIYFNHANGGGELFSKILDEMNIPYKWDRTEWKCIQMYYDED